MPTTLRRYAVEPQDLGCLTVYSIVVSHVMVILTWAHAPRQASSSEGVKPQPRGKWASPTLNICTPGGRRAQASCCLFRDAQGSGHTAFLPMGILLVEYQFHIIPPPPPTYFLLMRPCCFLEKGPLVERRSAESSGSYGISAPRSPISGLRTRVFVRTGVARAEGPLLVGTGAHGARPELGVVGKGAEWYLKFKSAKMKRVRRRGSC